MKFFFLAVAFLIVLALFLSYFKPVTDAQLSRENFIKDSIKNIQAPIKVDDREMSSNQPLFDSLNIIYKAKGFKDVCDLIASDDSIYKTADFMSGIVLGKDNFGKERSELTSRIYKERVGRFIKARKLNKEAFNKDRIILAQLDYRLCVDYLKMRHRLDDLEITEDKALQLYQEAYIKYK